MRLRNVVAIVPAVSMVIAGNAGSANPPESDPPPSAGHNLVYAPDLGLVLLVNAGLGGMSTPPAATRTRIWGWNGSAWRMIDSAGPPVRNLAGVAYDTRRNTLVMHGGTYDIGKSYGETWEWSVQRGWRRFTGAGPGIRDHTQLAYDAARGKCVLFGGSGENPNVAFADTWEFDGTLWERTASSGSMHDRALLTVGGVTETTLAAALLQNGRWMPATSTPEPPPRYLTDMAYDAKRNVIVLFGGGDSRGNDLLDDIWEFDGVSWKRIRS
jgi:hypothetical protein